MLKLAEFKELATGEKAAYVQEHGRYLHFRIQGWCKIDLYLIRTGNDSFYAELWYYYDLKTVGLVRVFEKAPPLEPYLENIHFQILPK